MTPNAARPFDHFEEEKKEESSFDPVDKNFQPVFHKSSKEQETAKIPSIMQSPRDSQRPPTKMSRIFSLLVFIAVETGIVLLLAAYLGACSLEYVMDHYFVPQIELMKFQSERRDMSELTYYHRECQPEFITAKSRDELILPKNASVDEAVQHMLVHGATIYQDLLTEKTSSVLREFIVEQNKLQEGWFVLNNENRYSWGIDMNMHPAFQDVFKELVANEQLLSAVQAIVGPNPAIIEFTAITSSYGAVDQSDHQDVIPAASSAKFGRTFVPSYSLFMPLQDTTYDMGATHICPGSHMCSANCNAICPDHNIPASGYGDSVWPRGWGALVNQQTTHKGMAHRDPNAPDRVVLIATFAPRPQTHRGVETRMISQGGSYSLKWTHWGHTLYDFLHSDTRMTEPAVRLRSLGLIRGDGYTWTSEISMRIANNDNGYNEDSFDDFIEGGGIKYWPRSWQPRIEDYEYNPWFEFVVGTVHISRTAIQAIVLWAVAVYLLFQLIVQPLSTHRSGRFRSSLRRLAVYVFVLSSLALYALKEMRESSWARNIRSGKLYNLQKTPDIVDYSYPGTLPTVHDVLVTKMMSSEHLASFTTVLDVFHPGTNKFKSMGRQYAKGYLSLPANIQEELAKTVASWSRGESSRFLTQNSIREWTEIDDERALCCLSHEELAKGDRKMLNELLLQLDSLEADYTMGRWRDMVLGNTTSPMILGLWRSRFLPAASCTSNSRLTSATGKTREIRKFVNVPTETTFGVGTTRGPPRTIGPRKPPFPIAWAKEGDVVEVRYECRGDEFYPAIVVEVSANDMTLSVKYFDGEEDMLNQECLRPFWPYRVGEEVDVRDEDDEWIEGEVQARIQGENGKYSYQILTTDDTVLTAPAKMMRRFTPGGFTPKMTLDEYLKSNHTPASPEADEGLFQRGDSVKAKFEGGMEWFLGEIVRRNPGGTYVVEYDDGDIEEDVAEYDIVLR